MSGRAIKGAVSERNCDVLSRNRFQFSYLFQDFRAQRSQIKDRGWLKHIGKLGFPAHALLRLYQMTVVFWDLVYLAIRAYKELVISAIFFVLPISKKTLTNEIVVVSWPSEGRSRAFYVTFVIVFRLWDRLVGLDENWLRKSDASMQQSFALTYKPPNLKQQAKW